jgi:amino acid transporter
MGDLPKIFGRTHPKRGTPVGAALLCSVVGTIFTLGYAILSTVTAGDATVDELFWSLFAFSSVIFLLPYIVLMQVFLRLRAIDPDTVRPYSVPGGKVWIAIVAWVPTVLLVLAAIFFVVNPFEFDPMVTVPIVIGIVIAVVIQEIFCAKAPTWAAQRQAETAGTV